MAEQYSICMDIGGTKILGAIFDRNEKPISRLKKRPGPAEILPKTWSRSSSASSKR